MKNGVQMLTADSPKIFTNKDYKQVSQMIFQTTAVDIVAQC